MSLKLCPRLSLQTGAKIIAIVDGVWSIVMIGFLVNGAIKVLNSLLSENARLVIPDGNGFATVILGVIFVAQFVVAFPLYKAAKRNITSGLWAWFIVAACSFTVFALDTLGSIRYSNYKGAALFSTFTIYKAYAVFVVFMFRNSVTGQEASVSYSATRGKQVV